MVKIEKIWKNMYHSFASKICAGVSGYCIGTNFANETNPLVYISAYALGHMAYKYNDEDRKEKDKLYKDEKKKNILKNVSSLTTIVAASTGLMYPFAEQLEPGDLTRLVTIAGFTSTILGYSYDYFASLDLFKKENIKNLK